MNALLQAIIVDDRERVRTLLKTDPGLATRQIARAKLCDSGIFHWIYVGDTALHLAAAGYRVEIVRRLLDAGADPNAAANHRRSAPLHYAADGYITGPAWNAARQIKTLACLLDAGAQINAPDKNGATALHRAVRTRCAAAVEFLLEAGADPALANKPGSTAFHLAVQDTGRGGAGAPAARAGQRQIIAEFLSRAIPLVTKDGKGNTVLDCARSDWIKQMLSERL